MSGGVDSSAAAALLLEAGYDVVGVTFKLWGASCSASGPRTCCGPEAVADAREVCQKLGVPFYFLDEGPVFQKEVIEYFAAEYRAGRTPNPCVVCNEHVKFASLLKRAAALDIPYVATGHYARVEQCPRTGRYLLKRGRDQKKDQSYFLFALKQFHLSRTLFPLGDKTKSDSRATAHRHQLKVADKEESMEICFVSDGNYGNFLLKQRLAEKHRGDIVDVRGRKLGEHDGIEFYTIGQRRGLRVSNPNPLYVIELDPASNRVVVGEAGMLERSELTVEQCNWIAFDTPPQAIEATVKIRYNHPGVLATVEPLGNGKARVRFSQPQRAVTPGQACVFYQDDLVLGGGWIGG